MSRLTVAAIQTSPAFGEIDQNWESALIALQSLPDRCALAVLPELFATGYQFRSREEATGFAEPIPDGPTCQRLLRAASSLQMTVVAGLVERNDTAVYNSSILARPDGTYEKFRKVHLFWDEKDIFEAGDLGFPVFDACDTKVGMMICFDWIYPEAARTLALGGATLICHPSNLVLPHCPQSMLTRCIENRVFAITANRVGSEHRTRQPLTFIGRSQVVSPDGERLASCDDPNPGVAVADLDLTLTHKQATPRNNLWEDRRPETYRL